MTEYLCFTMCLTSSLKIKTAFDEARPHVANVGERHDTHGWLIAVLVSEMFLGHVPFEKKLQLDVTRPD